MKIVLDTNTVISGLLWKGAPRQVLDLARAASIAIFTSPHLLNLEEYEGIRILTVNQLLEEV